MTDRIISRHLPTAARILAALILAVGAFLLGAAYYVMVLWILSGGPL
jgi:hypothetical protein